eukprot:CAMPEP_0194418026 /NCGR_PEP_ID=MMETSP0176-20130528/17110_1 /TAXON_ID=216777 /ORGANISM="Proboscia alata, Strain PI-D3" /LENGTH=88 /DNA_ID=CAMNT_0039224217 /DNA_START=36 /DNA_END=302 /DNA_ORIENTATION=+
MTQSGGHSFLRTQTNVNGFSYGPLILNALPQKMVVLRDGGTRENRLTIILVRRGGSREPFQFVGGHLGGEEEGVGSGVGHGIVGECGG